MIKSVTVVNPKGESLKMVLTRPDFSGIAVRSITGLGPPKANIGYTELATSDGGLYHSSRANTRNIVMDLVLYQCNICPTIEDARRKLYRYFIIKKLHDIVIETDQQTLYASGYIESIEPDIFSSMESVQVSIICVDPWFYQSATSFRVFSGVTPMFEFPFCNDIDEAIPRLCDGIIQNGGNELDTKVIPLSVERASVEVRTNAFQFNVVNVPYDVPASTLTLLKYSQATYDYFVVVIEVNTTNETPEISIKYLVNSKFNANIEKPVVANSPLIKQYPIVSFLTYPYDDPDEEGNVKIRKIEYSAYGSDELPYSVLVPGEYVKYDNLEFGTILKDTRAILDYAGDIDTGVIITIHAMGMADNIKLFNVETYEIMEIDTSKIWTITGQSFGTGDDIIVSTIPGKKSIQLLRDGVYYDIIASLVRGSSWFKITSGTNLFGFTADSGANNLVVSFTYRNTYGGI